MDDVPVHPVPYELQDTDCGDGQICSLRPNQQPHRHDLAEPFHPSVRADGEIPEQPT